MYDFHYNWVKKQDFESKLLFTDTDSLCYHVKGDIESAMKKDLSYFSNYNKDHPFYDSINKKVIGKFKNEFSQEAITEFAGLKSKMHSIQTETETESKKTAKGVKKLLIKLEITHEDYRSTSFDKTSMKHNMRAIRSQLHNIYSYELKMEFILFWWQTMDSLRMGSIRRLAIVK